MIQRKFSIKGVCQIGGYGYVSNRIGLLEPLYKIDGEEGRYLGAIRGSEFVVHRQMTVARLEKEIADHGAVEFTEGYAVGAEEMGVICFTRQVAKQLARILCLNSSMKPTPSKRPTGWMFVRFPSRDARPVLKKWGLSLLKAAQDELLKGTSAEIAEDFARTALFCFPDNDLAHRRDAHLRIIASLVQRSDNRRIGMACRAARWALKLPTDVAILADAKDLLDSLNLLRS